MFDQINAEMVSRRDFFNKFLPVVYVLKWTWNTMVNINHAQL